MAPTPLQVTMLGLVQDEPPEGRKAIPVNGIIFATGAEQFSINTQSIAPAPPKSIMSLWVDATNIAPGLSVNINTGLQNIVVQGGTQKYLTITCQTPTVFVVSLTGGAGAGNVGLILYNYNVEFTGMFSRPKANATSAASTGSGFSGGVPVPVKTPGSHGTSA